MTHNTPTVHIKKKDDTNVQRIFLDSAAMPQMGGLLSRIGRFLLMSTGFVHTETQCSFAYGALFVMAKWHSN